VVPWVHPTQHPKRHLDRIRSVFLHSSRQKVSIVYNGRAPFPKIAPSNGVSGPHLIHDSLCPSKPTNPNGISIGSAVFVELTSMTDRQTDRSRYSVGNNRPHLHVVLRCGLIKQQFSVKVGYTSEKNAMQQCAEPNFEKHGYAYCFSSRMAQRCEETKLGMAERLHTGAILAFESTLQRRR